MKGFFITFFVFLLWVSACIYYVSFKELSHNDNLLTKTKEQESSFIKKHSSQSQNSQKASSNETYDVLENNNHLETIVN